MNIHSGIVVTIVHGAACRTRPLAITKAKMVIHCSADRTQLARWEVAIDKTQRRTGAFRHMRQDAQEVPVSKVAYLAPPQALHTAKLQVFKVNRIVGLTQVTGKIPMPGFSLIRHAAMDSCQMKTGTVPIRRASLFARKGTASLTQRFEGHAVRQRCFDLFPIVSRQKSPEPKIKTCGSTRLDSDGLGLRYFTREKHKETPCRHAFDGERLDLTFDRSGLVKAVFDPSNVEQVAPSICPSRLCQRERPVLPTLAEFWRTLVLVAEKLLIAKVYTAYDILYRLRANKIPVGKPGPLFEPRHMLLQAVVVDVTAKPAVVAALKQDAVIVYPSGNINALVQMLFPLGPVQLEGKGFASHLHTLLVLDVLLHHVQGDRANRRDELAPRPKAWQTLFQPGIFGTKRVSRIAFDLADNLHNAQLWIYIQKQVDVIGHDLYAQHGVTVVALLVLDQFLKTACKRFVQYAAAILRAPDNVVLAAINQGVR